jgi:hypothetical protein
MCVGGAGACYRYVGPLGHKPSKRISAVTIHPWSSTRADPLGHVCGGAGACYRYVGPLGHKPSKRISAVTIHPWSCTHADPLGHVRGGSRCLLPICRPAGPQTVEANQRGNHPPKVLYACGSSGACAGLRVARPAMRSSIPRSFQEPKPGARRLRSSCR